MMRVRAIFMMVAMHLAAAARVAEAARKAGGQHLLGVDVEAAEQGRGRAWLTPTGRLAFEFEGPGLERFLEAYRPAGSAVASESGSPGSFAEMPPVGIPVATTNVPEAKVAPAMPYVWWGRFLAWKGQVGQGSFGVAHRMRVTCGRPDDFVVMKVVTASGYEDLMREVDLMDEMQGKSDYVASLVGSPSHVFSKWTGKNNLLMEYFNFGNMYELYQRDWINGYQEIGGWGIFFKLFYDAVRGVQALHEHGIVHRDLKPENVMLNFNTGTKQYHAAVIDLGLACRLEQCKGKAGTRNFLAPEVLSEEHISPENDVWALGVMLYEMFFRETPPWIKHAYRPGSWPNLMGEELVRWTEPQYGYMAKFQPTQMVQPDLIRAVANLLKLTLRPLSDRIGIPDLLLALKDLMRLSGLTQLEVDTLISSSPSTSSAKADACLSHLPPAAQTYGQRGESKECIEQSISASATEWKRWFCGFSREPVDCCKCWASDGRKLYFPASELGLESCPGPSP